MVDRVCSVDGCSRKHMARGWCSAHYRRWQKWGDPEACAPQQETCSVAGCDREHAARGWCDLHYYRWKRNGTTDRVRSRQTCTIDGCDKPRVSRGWCSKHLTRWERHGSPTARLAGEVVDGRRICSGCNHDVPVGDYTPGNSRCRPCVAAVARANPERRRVAGTRYRARKLDAFVEDVDHRVVFARDSWVCQICESPIPQDKRFPHPMSASLDHRIPLSRGGLHSYANSQAAHLRCNISKGNRLTA